MNNSWKMAKFGLVLLALPLVATAAASAHNQIAQSSGITIESQAVSVAVSTTTTVGLDRVHTVALNANGGIDGRIVSFGTDSKVTGLSESSVQFKRNGAVVGQATTDASGAFSIQNIPEGVYSFIASGANGFAAYSVRVVSDEAGEYAKVMEAAAVSQVASVKTIIDQAPPVTIQSTHKASMDEKGANRVVLKDGVLSGRVLSPRTGSVSNTQVHILKGGETIAKVDVNADGEFTVADMTAGIYDFVAVGPHGFAAVAFEAINFERQVENTAGKITYVSTAAQDVGQETPIYTDVLNVYLIQPEQPQQEFVEQQPVEYVEEFLPIEYAGDTFTSGGTVGSFGPSQSFSPGGPVGGRGRILAIAGLTVGVIALAGDGDGRAGTPVIP